MIPSLQDGFPESDDAPPKWGGLVLFGRLVWWCQSGGDVCASLGCFAEFLRVANGLTEGRSPVNVTHCSSPDGAPEVDDAPPE